jgi:hypothetical protein
LKYGSTSGNSEETQMANLLKNANFGAPPVLPGGTLLIGVTGNDGISAAPFWGTWNNSAPANICAYTSTCIVPRDKIDSFISNIPNQLQCHGIHEFLKFPPGTSEQILEVCTNGEFNGLVQASLGPVAHTVSSAWVFVLRGQVAIGTGTGGSTGFDATSTKTYEWEKLQAPNGGSPANEFIVYSASPDGAWFFIAVACVEPTHGHHP